MGCEGVHTGVAVVSEVQIDADPWMAGEGVVALSH